MGGLGPELVLAACAVLPVTQRELGSVEKEPSRLELNNCKDEDRDTRQRLQILARISGELIRLTVSLIAGWGPHDDCVDGIRRLFSKFQIVHPQS